jgi:hypothetical protein
MGSDGGGDAWEFMKAITPWNDDDVLGMRKDPRKAVKDLAPVTGGVYDGIKGAEHDKKAAETTVNEQKAAQEKLIAERKTKEADALAASEGARARAAARSRQRQGQASASRRATILTSPLGVPTATGTSAKKTLLGM